MPSKKIFSRSFARSTGKTIGANGVSFPLFYQARGSCPLGGLALYKLLPKMAKIDGDLEKGEETGSGARQRS
ncbi:MULTISPECIES: hypothetical protein [Moorena]|uniref:Uncharacterized protein n=1 Tax=Moorena producens 3L TaxID=489825 RepID=F4XU08_9CYAN|nr:MULTISPECIES: hypothetical protein [Moorena]NEQ14562.1 hypothetical protein [Moorena sp. SIO3E2]NES84161.1 hypothetical protein [Moorena sp. SIO2B7]EGJ31984.1 hypothetical protein LYNGBM3L_31610 [Moorena producens 3L]NEP33918.1 hypothetical protein [Moorena sp. SIO3B2]NEP64735.1 hypothetical protein [Moorena sp. SIO3A5]